MAPVYKDLYDKVEDMNMKNDEMGAYSRAHFVSSDGTSTDITDMTEEEIGQLTGEIPVDGLMSSMDTDLSRLNNYM